MMANLFEYKLYAWICLVIYFHSLPLLLKATNQGSVKHPATDFQHYRVILPQLFSSREKRAITSTHNNVDGGHIHDVIVEYNLNGVNYVLDMELNTKSFSDNLTISYQQNGQDILEKIDNKYQLCHYHGHIRGKPDSWAALSTCTGISGVIYDGKELFYLEPGIGKMNFLYKHSDITTKSVCGTSGQPYSSENNGTSAFVNTLRHKRDSAVIRGPYNANDSSRFIELELVVDNQVYVMMGKRLQKIHKYCQDIVNIVNRLYQPLNIFVVLVNIVVWNERDKISLSSDSLSTLQEFTSYREKRLMDGHHSDNGQLITHMKFDKGVVGKAFIQTICHQDKSSGVISRHSTLTALVAQTMAHEMGHNLGMDHDSDHCNCAGCLMAAFSNSMEKIEWSFCSRMYLADTFEKGKDFCLKNKPIRTIDSQVCGNGFVEAGEQCDCGLKDVCNNRCCNATTCTLLPGASCATGKCCDLETCRLKSGGQLCRSVDDRECDLPEHCTGRSEYCPDDVFKMDGTECDRGEAFCYRGNCPSHTGQCRVLWGPNSKNSEFCYRHNIEGSQFKNCGYDKRSKNPIKCKQNDVKCGRLQCTHTNEGILADTGSAYNRWWTREGHRSIDCMSLSGTAGLKSMDRGLVPNGAKCDDDKMCLDQKCVSAYQQTCPMNCSGSGVCNSKGNCHCYKGFSPPLCEPPGPGGSVDSGVISDLTGLEYFAIALYVVFLGIIPLIVIVIVIVHYKCYNRNSPKMKTPSKSTASQFYTNAFGCCNGNFCKQLHTFVLCKKSDKRNQQEGIVAQKNSHSPSSSVQKNSLTQENVPQRNFNNFDKEWKIECAGTSVKKPHSLAIDKHEIVALRPGKTTAPKLDIQFNPKRSPKHLTSDNVHTNKVFFESLDVKVKKPNVENTRVSSGQRLSKSSSLHKKSKGLHLDMPRTKENQMKTKLLKTPDSASITPDTPPVEKYFQTVRATTKELERKAGPGLTTTRLPLTPPPPPPAAMKPRF